MKIKTEYYTLITGSSEGIGLAFAFECASIGHNLVLVSIDKEKLIRAKEKINKKYDVKVYIHETDLSNSKRVFDFYEWCKKERLKVNFLINNVGVGSDGSFDSYLAEFYLTQLNLNNTTMVLLTRLFYDDLRKNSPSFILNMSSLGAYQPMPFKAVYAATKTFVYNFSRALASEFKKENIHVGVVCPGPVLTNKNIEKRIEKVGFIARKSVLNPEEVAAYSINKLFRRKTVIIPGFVNKIIYFISSLFPIKIKNYFISKSFNK